MDSRFLVKRHDGISFMIVFAHLGVVLVPLFISAASGPGVLTVLCWLWFGLGMNGILNLLHESAHYHVFKYKIGNILLGRYIIAPLVFADFDGYRNRHWDHHKMLGVDGETKYAYMIDIRQSSLWKFFLFRCLLLQEALSKFFSQTGTASQSARVKGSQRWLARVFIFQLIFLLLLVIVANWTSHEEGWLTVARNALLAYVFVYIYGLMGLTVFMATLRAIAEHKTYDAVSTRQGYASLRNLKCNVITRTLMGAYGFGEHYTHHKAPGIPYYSLVSATWELAANNPSMLPRKGYVTVLREIIAGNPGAVH